MWSDLFYRNPRLTALGIGFILVTGFVAYVSLGRQEDPVLSERFGNVTTVFPGASASRVEALVSAKLENALQEVPEVKEVRSLSRAGVSQIFVELKDRITGESTDGVWSEIRDQLNDVRTALPPGAGTPDLDVRKVTASTLVIGLYWNQDGPPELGLLSRLAAELEDRLGNIPGAEETHIYGEAEEEIRVVVDSGRLASVGLPVSRLAGAIALADSKVPSGRLRGAATDLLLEVEGELDSVARVRAVPLAQTQDGRTLRVGDIAEVDKVQRDPPAAMTLVDGRIGVAVTVEMESNLRVDQWARRARKEVEAFRATIPRGVGLNIMFDQSVYTEDRLETLLGNLLAGAIIVILVLVVTMGWKSALIVSSALPLTLLMVLAGMNLMNLNLHQISITGLIVALGLLIDNAIVVTDDYNAHRRHGLPVGTAISAAVRHLFVPLFASTATTALAFAPIALAPGGTGEFVGEMAVAVILSVLGSFALSMTVVPALSGYFSKQSQPKGGHEAWWRTGLTLPRVTTAYERLLDLVIRRPSIGIGLSLVLPAAGFALAGTLVSQFYPPVDRDQFQILVTLPPQTAIAETHATVLRIREILDEYPEIGKSHWFIGESAPRVYYNTFADQDAITSYASGFVYTRSAPTTNRVLPGLQLRIRREFPNAQALTLPFEQGPPFSAPVEVKIIGPDTDQLRLLGEKMRAILAGTANVTYTHATLTGGAPKLAVVADDEAARAAGFDLVELAAQLNAYLDGILGGSVLEGTEELPVRVQLGRRARAKTADLSGRALVPPDAGRTQVQSAQPFKGVPLASIAHLELKPELSGIARLNGERVNNIYGYLVPYILPSVVLKEFEARLAASDLRLPGGYRIETGGEAESRAESIGQLVATAGPLLILMVTVVVLSFNSFAFAGVVFLTGFLSVGLALFGVWLFGYPLGFTAIIGTLGLVGLSINGTIVVLSNLRADPQANTGDRAAMRRVTVESTRHIVATTVTTMGGLTPLILFGGTIWPPFATSIVGGVAGSAVLALVMAPAFFAIFRRVPDREPVAASTA